LTITGSSGTMIYGGPVPAITPAYSAFVLGQGDCVDHAADLHHDRGEREFSGVLSDHVLGCSLAEQCHYLR
jgi:hypothetical protein